MPGEFDREVSFRVQTKFRGSGRVSSREAILGLLWREHCNRPGECLQQQEPSCRDSRITEMNCANMHSEH